jgi:autotransporter-associated beta strand protein
LAASGPGIGADVEGKFVVGSFGDFRHSLAVRLLPGTGCPGSGGIAANGRGPKRLGRSRQHHSHHDRLQPRHQLEHDPAAPVAGGQSAQFANTGNASVVVTGPIAPDSWTFNANSQSYTVTGGDVNFGTTTGLVNNATAGSISIANNLGGAGAQLQQLDTSTLTLSGTNTYTGVTTISAGTLALTGTGSIAASSQINLTNAAATFDISRTTTGASIISLAGVSGSNVNLGTKTLTVTAGNGLDIYYGAIGGSGRLTVTGGLAELGGTNTYTGVTTINSGAHLVPQGTASIASSSRVIDNGALDLSVMSVDSSIKSLAAPTPAPIYSWAVTP